MQRVLIRNLWMRSFIVYRWPPSTAFSLLIAIAVDDPPCSVDLFLTMLGERVLKPPPQEWLRACSGPGRGLDVFVRTTHLYVVCVCLLFLNKSTLCSQMNKFMLFAVESPMLRARGSRCTMKRTLVRVVQRQLHHWQCVRLSSLCMCFASLLVQ